MPADEGLSPALGGQARVFFALWPDAALRLRLDEAAGRLHEVYGGRRIRPEKLHLTLLFVGAVPRGRLDELQAAAAAVRAPAFRAGFDQVECWRRNRIVFLGASQPPPQLYDLVADLERQVDLAGIGFDRRPYKAHITLLRNADCRRGAPADPQRTAARKNPAPPIVWAARDFVLVESGIDDAGARYRVLARWPLL